jgi:hypothetical protein
MLLIVLYFTLAFHSLEKRPCQVDLHRLQHPNLVRSAIQVLGEEEEYYRQIEEALLIIATPGIWFYLMFFAGYDILSVR